MDAYEWHEKGSDERRVARAGEDQQWPRVDVRSVDTANRVVRLPLTMNFEGAVSETVYHPGRNESPQEKYIGGKVPENGHPEGSMAFLLPEEVPVDEFRVYYAERRPSGKREAWWVP